MSVNSRFSKKETMEIGRKRSCAVIVRDVHDDHGGLVMWVIRCAANESHSDGRGTAGIMDMQPEYEKRSMTANPELSQRIRVLP